MRCENGLRGSLAHTKFTLKNGQKREVQGML